MSALDDLKTRIDSAIYTNTEQNITGDGLQTVLDDMVDTMGVSVSQNTTTGGYDLQIGELIVNVGAQSDILKLTERTEGLTKLIRNVHPVNLLDIQEIWANGYYDSVGGWHPSDSYRTADINVNGTEIFEGNDSARYVNAYNGDEVIETVEYAYTYRSPANATRVTLSYIAAYLPTSLLHYGYYTVPQGFDIIRSHNRLNPSELMDGFIQTNGARGYDSNYQVTGYIKVEAGKELMGGHIDEVFAPSTFPMAYVTAYDEDLNVLTNKGAENPSPYIVPDGVKYVRISYTKSNITERMRINVREQGRGLFAYDTYFERLGLSTEQALYEQEYENKYMFYTTHPSELNIAKRLQMGKLSKAYICLMSDDGNSDVATYSIPMCVSKGIPMTFAIMKGSTVLNEPNLTVLKNAINNNGITVAQHGWFRWDNKTEDLLNEFFDAEKEYWDSIGLEMKGAVVPADYMSDLCAAVAGSRFDILRGGYYGLSPDIPYYPNAQLGERSNLHAANCIGLAQTYDSFSMIDDAIANKRVIIAFYHEVELDATIKAGIEAWIDYALSKGVEFVTMDKLLTIL